MDELREWGGTQLLDLAFIHAGLVIALCLALCLARHIGRGVFCGRYPGRIIGGHRDGHPLEPEGFSPILCKARLQRGTKHCPNSPHHAPKSTPLAPALPGLLPPVSFPTHSDCPNSLGTKDKERKKNKKHFSSSSDIPSIIQPRVLPLPLCWCPPALYYLFLQKGTINPFFSSASKTFLSSPQLKFCFPREFLGFFYLFS